MQEARRYARSGVAIAAVLVAAGCVTAEPRRAPRPLPPSTEEVARREISERIARTVDATKRLDIDALAIGGGARRRVDGSEMSQADARAAVAAHLDGVQRTISLVVRLDSLRMTADNTALVYTMQRWERVLLAADGSRHRALTQNWLEQKWARGAGGWRGLGEVRETRAGLSTLDGAPVVLVEGTRPN